MLASAKWQEVKGKPKKINELILKTKAELKERPDNISQLSLDYWPSKVQGVEEFWL